LIQGYDASQSSFVRAFGDQEIDSAALLIPILGFLPIDDPKVIGTLHAIESRLGQGVLIRRYEGSDGLEGQDGYHLVSSLLFASCLALAGRVDEAGDRLAELCTYATSLGMFGEQVNPLTGETTGNFPSASVHIGLINAGLYVGAARGKQVLTGHLMGFRKSA
jgi:GH15 family glucan-1,4-alpha-glucosidase